MLLKFGVSGKFEWREYLPQSSRGWKFIIHSRRLGVQRLTQGVHGRLTDFFFFFFFLKYKFKWRKLHIVADFNEQSVWAMLMITERKKTKCESIYANMHND